MSEYIEASKHGAMTAAVEAHFGTAKARTMPGEASGKDFARGGDSKFNSQPMPFEDGSGFNYNPTPGHTTR